MKNVRLRQMDSSIEMANESMQLSVDLETGMLTELCLFGSEHAQYHDIVDDQLIYQNAAGIKVKDGLTGQEYSDPFGKTLVYYHEARKVADLGRGSKVQCGNATISENENSRTVTFDKSYSGAPFRMRHELTMFYESLRWDIVLSLEPGQAERSVNLDYICPIFRSVNGGFFPKGWKAWAALEDAPFDFGHTGGWGHTQASWYCHHFPYCSVNAGAGVALPMMDVYSTEYDLGMCLIAPPDMIKPELVFVVDKADSVLKLQYNNVGLRKGRERRLSLILYPHRGDWRNALGWFEKQYNDLFMPNNPRIVEQEGTMFYGVPTVAEKTIESWVEQMNLKWTEVLYNPIFGDYVPSQQVWDFDMLCTDEHPEKKIVALDKDKIRSYLAMLKRHGVSSFVYFNYGECDEELARQEFADAIVHEVQGERKAWVFSDGSRRNMTMNPDPDSKWGRFILKQIDDMFDEYPDLDGLFIDQMCYHSYDLSRDDGEAMIGTRPCYDTHEASVRMMKAIGTKLKERNKTSFANGPYNIEIMKYADGIMSEGSLAGLAKYSFACLNKPVMVLTYGVFGEYFEKVLKACLKYGAFPSTPWHHQDSFEPPASPPDDTLELYTRYLPLIELLRGRRWVLYSEPVSFPAGLDGNIFYSPKGELIVPFFIKESLMSNNYWNAGKPKTIEIQLNSDFSFSSMQATWYSVHFEGGRMLPAGKRSDSRVFVDIPEFTEAGVIVLEQ